MSAHRDEDARLIATGLVMAIIGLMLAGYGVSNPDAGIQFHSVNIGAILAFTAGAAIAFFKGGAFP